MAAADKRQGTEEEPAWVPVRTVSMQAADKRPEGKADTGEVPEQTAGTEAGAAGKPWEAAGIEEAGGEPAATEKTVLLMPANPGC